MCIRDRTGLEAIDPNLYPAIQPKFASSRQGEPGPYQLCEMADTLEENYLLDENDDAGSLVGSDDGAVSIQDEPGHTNETTEQHALTLHPSAKETKNGAVSQDEKKRKRKEKEKARKEKEEEEAKAAAEAAAAPAKEAGGEAEDVEMKDDVPAAAEEKGAEAEKKLEPVAEA
mgnify:CR=1 FL=1